MEVEPKHEAAVAIDMSSESSEAKIARLEKEINELEVEVEEARDAAEDMTGRAGFAAQTMRDMHSNPNGGYRLSGPSAHSLLEKSKAAQQRHGRLQNQLAAKKKEYVAAGGVMKHPEPVIKPLETKEPDTIPGKVMAYLSSWRGILGYQV